MGLLLKFLRKPDVKTGQHRCRPSSAQILQKAGRFGWAKQAQRYCYWCLLVNNPMTSEPEKVEMKVSIYNDEDLSVEYSFDQHEGDTEGAYISTDGDGVAAENSRQHYSKVLAKK